MLSDLPFIALLLAVFALYSGLCGFAVMIAVLGDDDEPLARMNGYLKSSIALTLGLVVSAVCLFCLAQIGLFTPIAVAASGLVLATASGVILWRRPGASAMPALFAARATDIVFVGGSFVLVLIHAMQAPGYWDDTMYHLPLARSYISHQGLVLNEYIRFPLVPQFMNLIVALGLMFGGDFGAQAFATLPIFVMGIGLVGAFAWVRAPILLGAVALIVLVAMTPVRHTLGYAYIDNGMAAMCWAATLCLAIWTTAHSSRSALGWLVLAAVLAGGAAGSKYFGAAFGVLLASYLIMAYRDLRCAVIFGAVMTAICACWYLRSYLLSGDPVHPVGGPLFGYYLWNAEDFLMQKREQHNFGVAASTLNLPGALTEAGAALLIPALGSALIPGRVKGFNTLRYIFYVYLAFWFVTSQVDRYLAPIFATGAFLSILSLYTAIRLIAMKARRLAVVQAFSGHLTDRLATRFTLAGVVGILGFLCVEQALKSHPTPDLWQAALEDRAGHRLMSAANDRMATDGDRLVQIGFENAIYFFDGTAMGDHFGKARYRAFFDCDAAGCTLLPPGEMASKVDAMGAKMLAVSSRTVSGFDPDAYAQFFKPVYADPEGVLLVRTREPPGG
ncbi:MAG: hypothetical protein AAGD47_02635 [Pseudomonadota bacterium]